MVAAKLETNSKSYMLRVIICGALLVSQDVSMKLIMNQCDLMRNIKGDL